MASSDKLQPLSFSSNSIASYNDWLAWKRALIYYLDAKEITDPARKKAVLMHKGGRELQEIFAAIEQVDPKGKQVDDPFQHAIDQLEKHFKPTTNRCYERFLFRQIRQGQDSIEQFVVKLRKQAGNCKFASLEEALCDQIIDGTSNPLLRQKILEQRLEKLPAIIELGKLLEAVHLQSKTMANEGETLSSTTVDAVARLEVRDRSSKNARPRESQQAFRRRCYRCGGLSHEGNDPACPAANATCHRCDKIGHFANKCRSVVSSEKVDRRQNELSEARASTSTGQSGSSKPSSRRDKHRIRALEKQPSSSSSDEGHVFRLQDPSQSPDMPNKVPLRIAGVWLNPVIDSGADVSLIDPPTWKLLRHRKVKFVDAEIDTKVYPYGRTKPLDFQRAVIMKVNSKTQSVRAKFFVLAEDEGEYETIIGRRLAIALGVLSIGENVAKVRHLCIRRNESKKLGKLSNVQLSIPLDSSVKPVAQPCRRVPFALRKLILQHTNELISDDVIEEVVDEPSEWISPIVPVIKKNGELRLCIDMRQANRAVRREKYPIPTFEELVSEMTDCEYFSRIDLRSAYHQVELSPESRKITTFVTPDGIFRFKRLYCGIKCAPEIFQRLMTEVLKGLPNVKVFFDDIIIFSKLKSDHEKHVNAVLDRLEARGLTINLKKSTFGVTEINFLGHKLSKNRISPNETNESAIKNFQPPENKKDLQSFLGLMNYVAKFIPNFSSLTEPLRRLIRKNTVYRWTAAHSEVFENLKSAVVGVKLSMFDHSATIQLFADASPVGLGAVLLQKRPGKSHADILGFASRSLSVAEQNYSQIEREALGLVWACERFRMYTLGKKFDLFTDHKPLEILFGPRSKPNARIERWVLRLQNFDYTVHYVEGPKNLADPFSRLGCVIPSKRSYAEAVKSTIYFLTKFDVPQAISWENFQKESEVDQELIRLREALSSGQTLPSEFLRVKFELSVIDNLVLRGDRLIPPQSLRHQVLRQAHEGHPGIDVMKKRLRSKVWWPNIDKEAEKTVKSCRSCQSVSSFNPPEPLSSTVLPASPWEYVAIDFMGPLPDGRFLLVVVDYFSRFIECVFTSSTSSQVTIKALYRIFARFGFPSRLKSDNAKAFVSEEFKSFLREYDVEHITSPLLWPQANGQVERQNRSILKRLKIAMIEKADLEIELSKFLLMYHSTPHSTTGRSPAELMFLRPIRDKLPSISHPSPLYEDIRETDAIRKGKGRLYADSRRKAAKRNLAVGDLVLLPVPKTNKLSPAFDPDPFTVVESSPGEVVVRRGERSYRRSSAFVKQFTPESVIVSPTESPRSSMEPVCDLSSPVVLEDRASGAPPGTAQGQLAKGQEASPPAVSIALGTTLTNRITRSGRQVRPTVRMDL